MGTDRCAYVSRLRRVDPVPKVLFVLMTLPVCLALDSMLAGLSTLVVLSLLNIFLGGQKPRELLHYLRIPMAFLVIGCLTIILRPIGEAEALWSFRLPGGFRWGVTAYYLNMGLVVFCKAMGAVSAMYFLSMNTPMTDLTMALERLHVPKLLVELMELIYRFIFLLTDEARRIRIAQESRLGYRGFKDSLSAVGEMASTIFLRALRRGDRIYAALESRGYTGTLTTLPEQYTKGGRLYLLGVGIALMQLLLWYLERRLF